MKPDPLDPNALAVISGGTLAHYERTAEAFREGTRDHDVSQNIAAFLRHIAARPAVDAARFRLRPGT